MAAGGGCSLRAALLLALVLAVLAACSCSPWGQDDVDRLREWQERQDERLQMQQRGLEERQRLRDDLMLERQYLRSDLQLHRERQQDERQTGRDERLNDHQRLHDDLLQERQVEQSDRQLHRQNLQDQGLDERQQLRDELDHDREREVEDLRRQREQLRDQARRDRERSDRERERDQGRREREQHRREQEREREQQRRERERDLRDQRRRWRRDADNATLQADAPAPAPAAKSYEGAQLWRVQISDGDTANLQRVEDDGVAQIWYSNATVWDLMVSAENQAHVGKLLADNKLAYTVVIPDMQRAILDENPALSDDELELTSRKGHRMTWQHYHRTTDMHGWMDYLAKTYPSICETLVIGSSVEGRPLKVLHIKGKPGSPAMWVDGGIHAREWITSASVSYMINELVENRDVHSAWLDAVDLYVLPLANPDGYEYSHAGDRMWRKNRRRAGGGGCDGIDLNRNFGYKWGGKGAGPQACQEIYRGSAPFSEPETSAIQSFVLARKASLKSYLSFHSYGQYVLYPWGYDRFVPPDHQDLQRVGTKLANAMRASSGLAYTVGSSAALLYPASGGSDDWAKGQAGLKYAFTIELRDTGRHGFVLPSSHILSSGKEVLAAVRTLAQEVAAL